MPRFNREKALAAGMSPQQIDAYLASAQAKMDSSRLSAPAAPTAASPTAPQGGDLIAQLNAPHGDFMGMGLPPMGALAMGGAGASSPIPAEAVPWLMKQLGGGARMAGGNSLGEQQIGNLIQQLFQQKAGVMGQLGKHLPGAGKVAGAAGIMELIHRGLQ